MQLPKIIRGILAAVFCSCIFFSAHAQSYYYLEAKVAALQMHAGPDYKILLSLFPDGSAKARIQYTAAPANKLYLYELSLSDTSLSDEDTARRYLMINTAPIPLLDPDKAGFIIPRFVFVKQEENYFTPAAVETENQPGIWEAAGLELAQQKAYGELAADEPFVSAFYFESDGFYRYLFNDRTKDVPLPRSEKLFLITVANTNAGDIGKSAAVDLKNVTELFTKIAASAGISKIFPLTISGNDYSKTAVEGALAAVKAQQPGPGDIIIFYFSGHGFRLPGDISAYPNLSFRTDDNRRKNEVGDYIPLEKIYDQIMAMKPKVCMVFGDCCNANLYENPVFGPDIIHPKGGGTLGNFNLATAKKLFLPSMPISLLIGSVQKDHLSVGNSSLGGYFTYFFTAVLEKNLWGYYNNVLMMFNDPANSAWLRILLDARQNTYWKAKATQCGKTSNDRCIQQTEIRVTPQ